MSREDDMGVYPNTRGAIRSDAEAYESLYGVDAPHVVFNPTSGQYLTWNGGIGVVWADLSERVVRYGCLASAERAARARRVSHPSCMAVPVETLIRNGLLEG